MKRFFKAALAVMLVLLIAVPLAACSTKEEKFIKRFASEYNFTEASFSATEIAPVDGYSFVNVISGTNLMLYQANQSDSSGNSFKVVSDDLSNSYACAYRPEIFSYTDNLILAVSVAEDMSVEYKLLDAYGNLIAQGASITGLTIISSVEKTEDDKTVVYREYSVLAENDIGEQVKRNFWLKSTDGKPGIKTEAVEKSDEDLFERDDYELDKKDFGSDDCYGRMVNNTVYVYDKDKKFKHSMYLPNYESANVIAVFDGVIIYYCQKIVGSTMSSEKVDYSYLDSEAGMLKVRYTLYVADIESGKVESSTPDYVIADADIFYDKDDMPKGAVAYVHEIEDKILSSDIQPYILKRNGELDGKLSDFDYSDAGAYYASALKNSKNKIEGYIVNNAAGTFLCDKGLDTVKDITNADSYYADFSSETIFLSIDGKIGAIDYEGKVVIPFKYFLISGSLRDAVYNGTALLMDDNDNYVRVSKKGSTAVEGKCSIIDDGIILRGLKTETGYTYTLEYANGTFAGITFNTVDTEFVYRNPFAASLIKKDEKTSVYIFRVATTAGEKIFKIEFKAKSYD